MEVSTSKPPSLPPGRSIPLPFLVGLLLLTSSACTRGGVHPEWAGTISDSAGVVVVSNPEEGLWAEGKAWILEEDLRIGTFGGDLNYQFGQVGTIALSSRDEIFVSDLQSQEVRVFSPEGRYLRTLGGPGSGPGELGRGASEVLITSGDTVLVVDRQNRRINRYGPDGATLESAPLFPERERPLRFKQNGPGRLGAQLRPLRSPTQPVVDARDAIVGVESSGVFGDTLLRVPTGGLFQGAGIRYFTSEPMWDLTDSLTVIYGVNSEYRIGFYDSAASLRRVVTKPFAPALITERDIRAIFFFLDQAWLDAGVPPSRLEQNRQAVSFAEFFPTYFTFAQGPEGSLWVQGVRPPGELSDEELVRYNFQEDFGATEWDVFDREGKYLGVVEMPHRFQPRAFYDDKIYGVWRDDLDVQYVLRLRIRMD